MQLNIDLGLLGLSLFFGFLVISTVLVGLLAFAEGIGDRKGFWLSSLNGFAYSFGYGSLWVFILAVLGAVMAHDAENARQRGESGSYSASYK